MSERKVAEDTRVVVSKGEFVMLPRGYIVHETWRIIDTDNFGGDYPNERFVADNIESEETAELLADAWNKKHGADQHGPRFARVVKHIEIAYALAPGFEP